MNRRIMWLAVAWLGWGMVAGAAPPVKTGGLPELQRSTYEPTNARDPFMKVGEKGGLALQMKMTPGVPFPFRLDGILYHPSDPWAIVNDTRLALNKPVTLRAGGAEIQVRAVEITRSKVVLEVAGQKVELRLTADSPKSKEEP